MESPLLTREDMLALLRIRSLTTLDAMVRAGKIPAPQRFGDSRRLFWHRATVDAFLARKFAIDTPTEPPRPGDQRSAASDTPCAPKDSRASGRGTAGELCRAFSARFWPSVPMLRVATGMRAETGRADEVTPR